MTLVSTTTRSHPLEISSRLREMRPQNGKQVLLCEIDHYAPPPHEKQITQNTQGDGAIRASCIFLDNTNDYSV